MPVMRGRTDDLFPRREVVPSGPEPGGGVAAPEPAAVKPARLLSLDAYRGFVMLAMASSGLGFAAALKQHPGIPGDLDGTAWAGVWETTWLTLAYQLEHVPWGGCAFWDLIQPSFMFMVGVALPFSFARRTLEGESAGTRFGHVLWRSLVLVLLGIFLSSNNSGQTNFTLVNVLTQIGLGYPLLYLLLGRGFRLQLAVAAVYLLAYGAWFATYTPPAAVEQQLRDYVEDVRKKRPEDDFDQFQGYAAHWNKHTNAAAAVDRWLLNQFPREGEPWEGKKFWINDGGYATLNFIPSFVTMLFGLMTGQLLRSDRPPVRKLAAMMLWGLACLGLVMLVDTTIWPVQVPGCTWTICPTVKRIWTPTWTLFSTGWTLWLLGLFYWLIDVRGYRLWSFPLALVGMNSIAMYVMYQLLRPWIAKTLKIHLTTVDAAFDTGIVPVLFDGRYSAVLTSVLTLLVLWLMCVWLYRQRIFVKV